MPDKKQEKKTEEDRAYLRRRRIISIITMAAFVLFLVGIMFALRPILSFIANPDEFRVWLDEHGLIGYAALVGVSALQVIIAFIPGEVVEIAAGYAYGAVPGMLLCLAGTAIGSSIVFGLTRKFGIKLVEAFISREKIASLRFINTSKKRDWLTFLIFFIPGTPKDVVTYFIGLTPMKLKTFLAISLVARIPSVVSSTIGGNALGTRSYTFAVLIFVLTGIISLIGVFI